MKIKIKGKQKNIALIQNDSPIIVDIQSALDFAMTINYDTRISNLILSKACITEDFFILSTQLAGELLQKYVNYGIKLAIVGDFSYYTSKSLHDFIYESNHGQNFFFVATEKEAIEKIEACIKSI